jgi:hypothetical protein
MRTVAELGQGPLGECGRFERALAILMISKCTSSSHKCTNFFDLHGLFLQGICKSFRFDQHGLFLRAKWKDRFDLQVLF